MCIHVLDGSFEHSRVGSQELPDEEPCHRDDVTLTSAGSHIHTTLQGGNGVHAGRVHAKPADVDWTPTICITDSNSDVNAESGLPYVIRSADWKSRVFSECVTASWLVSPSSRNTFGGYVIAHENSRLDGQCVDATFVANEMKMAVVFSSFKQISTNRCQL